MSIKRSASFLAVLAAPLLLAGCVFAPVVPPRGLLYTDQSSPLFRGGGPGEKTGEASAHNILFLVGWGDASLNAAIEDGDLNSVSFADYRFVNYFIFYQKFTLILHGN